LKRSTHSLLFLSSHKLRLLMKGMVQVYTGNGKGKTTAALGLAFRAAGVEMKTYIAQFAKGMTCSELNSIAYLQEFVTLKQYGKHTFIKDHPNIDDVECAQKGLKEVENILKEGKYDVVILDEANIAVYFNLFTVEELIHVIHQKKEHVEVIVTGRHAHTALIEFADLVTEMKEVKHYYQKGIIARKGIES